MFHSRDAATRSDGAKKQTLRLELPLEYHIIMTYFRIFVCGGEEDEENEQNATVQELLERIGDREPRQLLTYFSIDSSLQTGSSSLLFLAAGRKCPYGNGICGEYCKSSLPELTVIVSVPKQSLVGLRACSSTRKAKGIVPKEPKGWQSLAARRIPRGIFTEWFPCPWLLSCQDPANVKFGFYLSWIKSL